jgi:hypothetical protein
MPGSNPEDASLRNAVNFLIETRVRSSFQIWNRFFQLTRLRTGLPLHHSL